MTTWLIRRLIQAMFVVLVMTAIVFLGLHVIGNPVDILISPQADQAERARAIAALGLDKPLWQQYLAFLRGAAHGDLGNSFVFNEPALRLIAERMPATMELAVTAVLLTMTCWAFRLVSTPGCIRTAPPRARSWRAASSASRCRPSGSG